MPKPKSNRRSKYSRNDRDFDMGAARREISELASTGYSQKDRNQFKRNRLQALGARSGKNKKVPYTILQGMKKKQKHREQKALLNDQNRFGKTRKLRGLGSSRKSRSGLDDEDYVNQLRGNRRGDRNTVGDGSRGFTPTVGRYRRGALILSEREIAAIKASS